jgi:hypothetical protein
MQSKGTPGENMPFLSSCPLYTDQNYMHYPLMEQMRLSFIDSALCYRGVLSGRFDYLTIQCRFITDIFVF